MKMNDSVKGFHLQYCPNISLGSDAFETDVDIPDSVWNLHLTKYKDIYRVKPNTKNNEIINCILCKPKEINFIHSYSLVKEHLIFVGTYKSPKGITYLKRKLKNYCKVTLETETEINVVFPESKLEELVDIFKIYRKKKLSKKHRDYLRKHMAEIRINKKTRKKSQKLHKRPTKGILLKYHLKRFCVCFPSFLTMFILILEGSLIHFTRSDECDKNKPVQIWRRHPYVSFHLPSY